MGQTEEHTRQARSGEFVHSIRAAQTLIALSRYENVTGFTSEFEVPLEQWRQFSRTKIPDGVIQVTRGDLIYELAVEVEVTPKTWTRSEDFLNKYEDAFAQGAGCSGVPFIFLVSACAQGRAAGEKPEASLKLSPEVVQGAVTFEPGTKDGAVVPEISAPRLRAIWVPEKVDGNRLIEAHREWEMQEGTMRIKLDSEADQALQALQSEALKVNPFLEADKGQWLDRRTRDETQDTRRQENE